MWRGSVERNRGPMNKKRIGGAADQGARAMNHITAALSLRHAPVADCARYDTLSSA